MTKYPRSERGEKENMKKKVIIIAIVALLGIVLIANSGKEKKQSTETSTSPTAVQVQEKNKFTVLSGIEKDPQSDAYGELVVPEINIWENTGSDRGKVVGKIPHEAKVKILEEKTTDQLYYKVESPDGLTGWVSELFVTEVIEE